MVYLDGISKKTGVSSILMRIVLGSIELILFLNLVVTSTSLAPRSSLKVLETVDVTLLLHR